MFDNLNDEAYLRRVIMPLEVHPRLSSPPAQLPAAAHGSICCTTCQVALGLLRCLDPLSISHRPACD